MDLDNLPPIDIPVFKPTETTTPPVPPAADAPPAPSPAASKPATTTTPVPAPTPISAVPGIRRFAGVEPKLAGGSLPDASGLDWLVDKGYRTILDLRENPTTSPSFLSDVDRRGLRYVALPITLKTLDSNHINRFKSELALADARPLFFCDNDGTRAGAVWYVYRITVDHVDPQVAKREAEDIGLNDEAFLKAATAYLDTLKPATAPKTATAPPRSPNRHRRLPPPRSRPSRPRRLPRAGHCRVTRTPGSRSPP